MKEFSDEAIVAAYDSEADAAYIWFVPRDTCYRIERTVDVGHNVHLDLDANGHVLGIELTILSLGVTAKTPSTVSVMG